MRPLDDARTATIPSKETGIYISKILNVQSASPSTMNKEKGDGELVLMQACETISHPASFLLRRALHRRNVFAGNGAVSYQMFPSKVV